MSSYSWISFQLIYDKISPTIGHLLKLTIFKYKILRNYWFRSSNTSDLFIKIYQIHYWVHSRTINDKWQGIYNCIRQCFPAHNKETKNFILNIEVIIYTITSYSVCLNSQGRMTLYIKKWIAKIKIIRK